MIPINEAIETGAWLNVICENSTEFRLRLREFVKIDLSTGFSPDKFSLINSESNVWLLRMDIVPMNKNGLATSSLEHLLYLADDEGFMFRFCKDTYLTFDSSFARTSELYNFCRSCDLPPKVSKSGAFAYELPEFFEDMNIDALNGKITEL